MKREEIKKTFIRILLIASLVAILLIAMLRGMNKSQTSSQPQNMCDGCKNKAKCENVQPAADTTNCATDSLCIKSIKR